MQQYLDRYAEIEASCFDDFEFSYDHLLCIPAFAESCDFLAPLISGPETQSVLIILVLNAHIDAPQQQLTSTQEISVYLKQQHSKKAEITSNIHLLGMKSGIDVLLVERCTPGNFLQHDEGVGLARKIACDIACMLINNGKINSNWIHTTDADALLPADYFHACTTLDPRKDSAGLFPFLHTPHPDKGIQLAQQLYDQGMDYYVAGLDWAGSPWAYHTIGSTLVINAHHYAQVRGFSKRQAGEDFYLLNKLAKIGRIRTLLTSPIKLESRLSDRVPFGTGPALNKIMAMDQPLDQYLYYHPECFRYLKCWLSVADLLHPDKKFTLTENEFEKLIPGEEFLDIDCNALIKCLHALGAEKALVHAYSHSSSKAVFDRHLQNWFDSFITLKFIHWMRDNIYPSKSIGAFIANQEEPALPFLAVLEDYAPALPA